MNHGNMPKSFNSLSSDKILMKQLAVEATATECYLPESLPKLKNSWIRLVHTTAWTLRFISSIRYKQKAGSVLSRYELESSERTLLRQIQFKSFSVEILTLQQGEPLKDNSPLFHYLPHLDENSILRAGKLSSCKNIWNVSAKFPIIVPSGTIEADSILNHYVNQKDRFFFLPPNVPCSCKICLE